MDKGKINELVIDRKYGTHIESVQLSGPPGESIVARKIEDTVVDGNISKKKQIDSVQLHGIGLSQNTPKVSIIAALWNKVQEKPDFKILSWVDDQCKEVNSLTYTQLWEQSGAVQQLLQEKNLKPGDRIMICYPFGLEFLAGFFGAIRAGMIPCSVYPPNPKQPKTSIKIFSAMAMDAGAKYALTTKQFQRAMGLLQVAGHRPGVTFLSTDTLKAVRLPFVEPDMDSTAFVQYTSGSTSSPKGVVISHRAIAHNIHVTTHYMTDFKMDVGKIRYQGVSWLPQYHDMGLINGFLCPIVSGAPCANASPFSFIKNPLIWADMIEKYQATCVVSPNFGWGLLAKRLQQTSRKLDASTITTAVNSAEPISVATLKEMVDVLGISQTSVLAAYGAAESVATISANRGIATSDDGVVACGDIQESLQFDKTIVILDDSKRLVPDGMVGQIHFSGPDLAAGYWGNPTKTEEIFKVRIADSDDDKFYCDSGDLGMIQNGKLFITGRAKELIIINGVNKYPTDLERSVEAAFLDSIRPGCTVAFQYNESQVGCVLELRKNIQGVQIPSVDQIKSAILTEHAISLDYLVILKAHTIPKTTSGKLRRLEAGEISRSAKWPQKSVIKEWKKGQDSFCDKLDMKDTLNRSLPQASPPPRESIISALWNKVQEKPDFKILSWVDDQCKEVSTLTYAELWEQSGAVQQLLQQKNANPGDRVMICYPFGLEFLAGLFGSMRAGVIPCSVYPPNPKQPKNSIKTFAQMTKDAGAKYALTTKQFQRAMGLLQVAGHRPGVTWLATDTLKPVHLPLVEPDLDSPAFIQYTSGSTSAPKGVVISHRAVMHNSFVTTQNMTDFKMDVGTGRYLVASWLPQYHDMGLMNGFLMPLVSGTSCVNTSPLTFIKNPLIWADMIEKYQATSIISPNFGYGLLAKRLVQAGRRMDGSSITSAVNGAEPVSVATLKQMVDVLGIQKTAIVPAYGAAESVVFVGAHRGIEIIDGFVACGDIQENQLFDKSVVILDESKQLVPDGTVGRIHLSGPDLASGYWGNPKLTEEIFKVKIAGSNDDKFYCDSGDLGMIKNSKLFITGRAKEVIIINGVNKYPTDLERSVEAAFPDTVRPGCCVAFQWNEEKVGIVIELRKDVKSGVLIPNDKDVKVLLSADHGVLCGYVCFLTPHTVPKTTSGKLKRLDVASLSKSSGWKKKCVIRVWQDRTQEQHDVVIDSRHEYGVQHQHIANTLSRLAADVAGIQVSRHESIASLGLSSMDTVKLHGLLVEQLDIMTEDFPLEWLFDGERTISDLAENLCTATIDPTNDPTNMEQDPYASEAQSQFTSTEQFSDQLVNVFEDVLGVTPRKTDSLGDLGVASMNSTMLHEAITRRLGTSNFPVYWLLDDELPFHELAVRLYQGIKAQEETSPAHSLPCSDISSLQRDTGLLSPPLLIANVRTAIQIFSIFIPPMFMAAGIFPSALFLYWMNDQYGTEIALLMMPISTLMYTLTAAALLIALKWILLGKQRPGVAAVWSGQFARRWLVRQCSRICWRVTPWAYLGGTKAIAILHRLLGCKLGHGVSLEPGCIEDYDLVEVGDFSSISGTVLTETVSLGVQTTYRTRIGCHSAVLIKAIISPNVKIEDNVTVGIRCAVPPSATLESGTEWVGKPAKKQALKKMDIYSSDLSLSHDMWLYSATQYGTLVLSSYLWALEFIFAFFIGLILWGNLGWMGFAPLIWVPATCTLVVIWIVTVVAKKLLLGKLEEGTWPLYGSFHCRKFLVDHMVDAHLFLWIQLSAIFGCPFIGWSRLHTVILQSLGSKITLAKNIPSELWTAYDLLQCSGTCTFGGGTSLHVFSTKEGYIVANKIHVGEDVFIGTTCALVAPLVLEDGATVAGHGVATGRVASTETVINTMIMKRPSDQRHGTAPARSVKSDVAELAVGITVLAFIVSLMGLLWLPGISVNDFPGAVHDTSSVVLVGIATMGFGYIAAFLLPLCVAIMLLISKKSVVGTYKSTKVQHGSFRYHLCEWDLRLKIGYEQLFMDVFSGTCLEVLFHKLMGAHLGNGVYLDGVYFFEHDLIHVGSYTSITGWVGLAPHRIDRSGDSFSKLRIGNRCNVRCDATLHGNDVVDDDTTLDALSMPLIGSHLNSGTWRGYPATKVDSVEPMPARPPIPLWYVLLQRPSAAIYGTVFVVLWGLYCLWSAVTKSMKCSKKVAKSSSNLDTTSPLEPDIEAGYPSFIGTGPLTPDFSGHEDKEDVGMFEEFNFDHCSWEPSMRMINMQIKAQHTWWEWACFIWEFDVDLRRAIAEVSLGGWVIPSEILSATLELSLDGDRWLLSISWLQGEPQRILLNAKTISVVDVDVTVSSSEASTDAIVVGAGIQGLCFARDLASLGYTVLICERSSQIGGVWAANNYPGLRLHSSGYTYRCASLTPRWNHEHPAEEHYRPSRDEILNYCNELLKHENITLQLNSPCDYQNAEQTQDEIVVPIAGANHRAKFLFVTVTSLLTYKGKKHIPEAIPANLASLPCSPRCFHSSDFSAENLSEVQRDKIKLVVVGSGKASIDLLQQFEPGDQSVVWAHRGHTAFFSREQACDIMTGQAETHRYYFDMARQEGLGRHWSELALEDGKLFSCEGPITRQRVKTARGICDKAEIDHANSFHQFYFHSIKVKEDGRISFVCDDGSSMVIDERYFVVWCTGQLNPAYCLPKFNKRIVLGGAFSVVVPMGLFVSLVYAIEQLGSKSRKVSELFESAMNYMMEKIDQQGFQCSRELEDAVFHQVTKFVTSGVLTCDPGFHPGWRNEWYSAPTSVAQVLDALLQPEIKQLGAMDNLEPPPLMKLTLEDYEKFHNMTSSHSHAQSCLDSFTGAVLYMPHNYSSEDPSLHSFQFRPTGNEYYHLTMKTFTREATLRGQTKRVICRDADIEVTGPFVAESDIQLRVESHVFDFIRNQTHALSLKVIRHYEYTFGGRAQLNAIMLHVLSDNGTLSLVEVLRNWDGSQCPDIVWGQPPEKAASSTSRTPMHNNLKRFAIPENLPTQKLPKTLVDAIKAVELDEQKLQCCFEELNLHRIPALVEAWKQHPKTSHALQDMCKESIHLVESNLPTVVQFCHFASQQQGGVLRKTVSAPEILSSTVHAGYVLEWATKQLAKDRSLLETKLQDDIWVENSLTEDMHCYDVPPEAQFLLNRGQSKDPLFGNIDTFIYLKARSVEWLIPQLPKLLKEDDSNDVALANVDGLDPMCVNVLEAVWWLQDVDGHYANAYAGQEVARHDYVSNFREDFFHLYKAWNLAFCLSLGASSQLVLSKLLIPSVCKAVGSDFYLHRIISLYLAAQATVRSHIRGDDQLKLFEAEAVNVLGSLNDRWASHLSSSRRMGKATEEEFKSKVNKFTARCNAIHGSAARTGEAPFNPQWDKQMEGTGPLTSTDIIVVGAGIQGLCFARDMASLGQTVLVCERSAQIGGVWAANNYPGLQLHLPGHMYRCASLAPGWNHKHSVEENYRPTRDEILDYCNELVDHKNITLQLNSSCDYQKAEEVKDGIVVPIAAVQHRAKFLFVSVNSTFGFQGTKHLPEALPSNLASLPCSPQCFHSSEFSAEDLSAIKHNKTKLVIVGSGKAAIDLLQQFQPGDKSVIWAHRGHTAFVPRTNLPMDEKVQMLHHYFQEAAKEGLGRHWSELALEDGKLIACDGPMKQHRVKCKMGICDESEIDHANSFDQFYLHSITVNKDGRISLVYNDGASMCFNEQDCVVWCTGQRNSAFEVPKLKKRLATAGAYSAFSFPMYTFIPLLSAIDQLASTGLTSQRIEKSLDALLGKIDPQKYQNGKDLEDAVFMATNAMPLLFFSCDPAIHPGWRTEWYAKNVPVVQVLKSLLRPETKHMGAFLDDCCAAKSILPEPRNLPVPIDAPAAMAVEAPLKQQSYGRMEGKQTIEGAWEGDIVDVDNVSSVLKGQNERLDFEDLPADEPSALDHSILDV